MRRKDRATLSHSPWHSPMLVILSIWRTAIHTGWDKIHCFCKILVNSRYSDLTEDLLNIQSNPERSQYCSQRLLCRTLAGNNVHLLTISTPDCLEELKGKICIVLSARYRIYLFNEVILLISYHKLLFCTGFILEKLQVPGWCVESFSSWRETLRLPGPWETGSCSRSSRCWILTASSSETRGAI